MKLSKNSNYELRSYYFKVISQLVCEIISFENVIRRFRSRNEHRVMGLYFLFEVEDTTVSSIFARKKALVNVALTGKKGKSLIKISK